jgi:ABC-type sugar transport system substrate-binding protein
MHFPYSCSSKIKHGLKTTLVIGFLSLFCISTVQAKLFAVSMSNEDNFLNLISTNIEKAVDEQGDDVYIDSADGEFATQLAQIKSYAAVGVDAIIVVSVAQTPEQNKQLIDAANKIPMVFVNREPLDDLKMMPSNSVYVGSNEEQSGTLEMEELARLAGYKGNVVMLIGEETHPAAQMRTEDVKNVLKKYPDMKLVESKTGNWQRNQGYKITSDWIKNKIDFKVIVANNDEMIIGAVMALRDAGLNPKDFYTGGIDATQDALLEMQKGELSVTVLQDAAGQARAAVNSGYRLINGLSVESPYWVPFRLVTQDNLAEYLNK